MDLISSTVSQIDQFYPQTCDHGPSASDGARLSVRPKERGTLLSQNSDLQQHHHHLWHLPFMRRPCTRDV
jgi:hypothetical protein